MKDLYILNILDLFKHIYKAFGVNYEMMRLIVHSKLIMDGRRNQPLTNNDEVVKDKNTFYTSLIIYSVIGLISSPIIIMDVSPIIKTSLYFSFFMIMILSVFISDFSSVILDVNDKEVIATKGIDIKTLNAAKITHIFIYISLLSLAIGGGGLIASIRYGIKFFLTFLVSIFLIDILMIIVTAIMYIIILKLFSGEKLKDMLNAFQILFMLVFVVGYQFVGRAFTFVDLKFLYETKLWNILIPPMWFGANFNLIQAEESNNIIKFMSILSIVIPIISIIIYIKLIPIFEYNLQKLNDNTYKNTKTKEKISFRVSKIICKNEEEKAFFNFVYDVLSKDRDFKTKIYPSLAMGAFMPFIMMLSMYDGQGILNYIQSLKGSYFYLNIYLFVLICQTIMTTTKFSSQYQASWIYDILPIKNKQNIYTGMFKATIYKLILPIFILISVLFIIMFGFSIIINLAIAFTAMIITCMASFKFNEKELPFSWEYKNTNSSSNIIIMIKSMLVVGILVLIHFVVGQSTLFTIIYLVLLILFIKLMWGKIFTIK